MSSKYLRMNNFLANACPLLKWEYRFCILMTNFVLLQLQQNKCVMMSYNYYEMIDIYIHIYHFTIYIYIYTYIYISEHQAESCWCLQRYAGLVQGCMPHPVFHHILQKYVRVNKSIEFQRVVGFIYLLTHPLTWSRNLDTHGLVDPVSHGSDFRVDGWFAWITIMIHPWGNPDYPVVGTVVDQERTAAVAL